MRKIVPPGQAAQGLGGFGMGPPRAGGAKPLQSALRAGAPPGMPAPGGRQSMSPQAYEAYGEAKEILAVAEREAERIRHEAAEQRDACVRQGYEEGYRQGYEEALKSLARLEKQYHDVVQRLEPQLVQLSIAVAEKIIGEELELRPNAIVDIVSQALRTVRHQKEIVIRCHPSRADALETDKRKLLGVLTRAQEVRIVSDESLRPNGCVIETEVGRLDADLDNQLRALQEALSAV